MNDSGESITSRIYTYCMRGYIIINIHKKCGQCYDNEILWLCTQKMTVYHQLKVPTSQERGSTFIQHILKRLE